MTAQSQTAQTADRNIIHFTTATINDIDFYVRNSDGKAGTSQNGLAKLAGVGESTVRYALNGGREKSIEKSPNVMYDGKKGVVKTMIFCT